MAAAAEGIALLPRKSPCTTPFYRAEDEQQYPAQKSIRLLAGITDDVLPRLTRDDTGVGERRS